MRRFYLLLIVVLASYSNTQAQCTPFAAFEDDITKAIAFVTYNGMQFTGTVVNNQSDDGTNYFLTSAYPFNDLYCDGGNPNIAISFKWMNGTTTQGANLVYVGDEVALLELNSDPPFETISYLGVTDLSTSTSLTCFSYAHSSPPFLAELLPDNIEWSGIETYCNGSGLFYRYEQDALYEATKVVSWDSNNSRLDDFHFAKGAPLINSNGQIAGIFVTKLAVGSDDDPCGNDNAYFSFGDMSIIHSYIGNNTRSIKIEPCKDEIVESEDIEINKTSEASIRIIGKSKVNNVQVRFKAGAEIILEDGFESGNDFIAEIEPCVAKITPIAKRENYDYDRVESKNYGYESTDLESIRAYPTIEVDDFVIIESNELNTITYVIVSLDGKIIVKGDYNANDDLFVQKIDLPNISAGIYFLKIESGSELKTIKLIKQ